MAEANKHLDISPLERVSFTFEGVKPWHLHIFQSGLFRLLH